MPLDKAVPINVENAVSLVKNFSKNGLNSIVEYPLGPKKLCVYNGELKDSKEKIYFFTLAPRVNSTIKPWNKRTYRMGNRKN